MDILSLAAIQLQCFECGGSYLVPLRDILLSHKVLHDGCPVQAETECPPVFQSRLASHGAINAVDEAWRQLERRANADGGELVLMSYIRAAWRQENGDSSSVRRYTGSRTKHSRLLSSAKSPNWMVLLGHSTWYSFRWRRNTSDPFRYDTH
jgi:hypothetical protein